ncbi:hypothetical protein N4R57_13825 [Rhodobacteraceae bacterium D3-12]|nr:hypothetical protein N4R57_13825 [Rhodobacteraceae bacterium D3-12]
MRDVASEDVADLLCDKISEVDETLADLANLRGMLLETLGQACPLGRA